MRNGKISLKISFGGILGYITSESSLSYEEVLDIAAEKFGIKCDDRDFLEIYDADGFIFNKQSFEYLLIIFPICQRIFHLRINYNCAIALDKRITNSTSSDKARIFGSPVRRQNCFLGTYPQEPKRYKPYKKSTDTIIRDKFKSIRV